MEAERRNQYSLTTTTNSNNNSVWKTAGLVSLFIIGLGCLTGIAYLIGQNSTRYNRCKC